MRAERQSFEQPIKSENSTYPQGRMVQPCNILLNLRILEQFALSAPASSAPMSENAATIVIP